MSTCPVVMLSNLALDSSSPPSSPHTRLHRLGSGSSKTSTSSLHKISNLAAHATPSSPSAVSAVRFTMASSSPPPSPGCRKLTSHVSALAVATTTTTPPTPTASVPCNNRRQPVAQKSVRATKGGKRKLGPGCGLLDWIRLCRSKTDLAGNGGTPRPVSLVELAQHDKEDDAWTAIRGKVYNLTHYMKFHPGGRSELMRGAGKDCTILFDEAHNWVNVESTLKACYIGPLVASSPNTQRRNSANIVKNNMKLRKESLVVPTTLVFTEGVNKQAISSAVRKNSITRNETQAATACEETDGSRQISPESPVKSIVSEPAPRKISTTTQEAASNASSIRLSLPPTRIRRTSEPHPRFDWGQSEKVVTLHIYTKSANLKASDVTIDANEKTIEAAVFIYDFVFEIRLVLAHGIIGSQVNVNHGHVEILLKKEDASIHWESIGTPLEGHLKLQAKSKRGIRYHATRVESIKKVTHDTNLYTLRLPTGSYLTVPTGYHLSIKAIVDGESVERAYTPVSTLEALPLRHSSHQSTAQDGHSIDLMIKLYSNGKMSRFLSHLKEGDEVIVSDSEGSFDAANRLKSASDVLLIAAGSGFTPMVKILRDYLASELNSRPRVTSASEACGEEVEDPDLPSSNGKTDEDELAVNVPKCAKLLFANKKEKDIMYKEELDHLARATNNKFKVTHILSEANSCWGGLKGRIGKTLLENSLPAVKDENRKSTLVCVCGPEPFLANVSNMLLDMEFPDECIQCFQ